MQAKVIAKPVLSLRPKEPSFEILNLKECRETVGLSLQEVADLAGISKSYLHDLETGRRAAPAATANAVSMAIEAGWEAGWRKKKSQKKS